MADYSRGHESSFQDAVQALQTYLGNRWEGVESDGRDEMVRVLNEKLGYDRRDANMLLDAMIDSGTLRYHTESGSQVAEVPVVGAPSTGAPVPFVPEAGYWQIGTEEPEAESNVRKGQVTPS
jgi:hypothetical protein